MAVVRTVDAGTTDLKEVPTLMGVLLDPCKWGESPGLANPLVPMPCIQKRFDVTYQWLCDDTNLDADGEKVSTLQGAVTWQVNANRFIRWGFVNPGTVSFQNAVPSSPVALNTGPLSGNGLQLYQLYNNAVNLTWVATPLPYDSNEFMSGWAQVPGVSTWVLTPPVVGVPSQLPGFDMSANFDKVRAIAGFASLGTTTSTIGSDASSSAPGRFCVGNVNSLVDVMQVPNEDGTIDTFNSETIVQASMPPDEGIRNIPPQEGLCTILGPDVLPVLAPANPDMCDRYDPANEQYVVGTGWPGPTNIGGNGVNATGPYSAGTLQCVYAGWVTPWNVALSESVNDSGSSKTIFTQTRYQMVNFTGGMDPCGVIDTDLMIHSDLLYQNITAHLELVCSCVHVFAVCHTDGTILYNSIVENPPSTTDMAYQNVGVVPQNSLGQCYFQWNIRPGQFHKGVPFGQLALNDVQPVTANTGVVGTATRNSGGMYIGTQIIVSVINTGSTTVSLYSGLRSVGLRMRARSFNVPGEVGPARVFQFNGLTNGTVLEFKATLHVQGTPTGPGLPSVRASRGTNGYFDEENWDRIIRQFNDPECDILHRNWTLREYVAKGRNIDSSELRSSRYRKMGKEKPVRLASAQDTVETTTTVGKKGIKRTSEMLRGTDEFIAKHAKRLEGETVPGEELVNISQIHVPPPNSTQTSNAPVIPSDHGNPILDRD